MPSPWLRRELRAMAAREPIHYRASIAPERNLCGRGLRWTASNSPSKVDCPECLERLEEQGIAK